MAVVLKNILLKRLPIAGVEKVKFGVNKLRMD
jgi:hypothetical protein